MVVERAGLRLDDSTSSSQGVAVAQVVPGSASLEVLSSSTPFKAPWRGKASTLFSPMISS